MLNTHIENKEVSKIFAFQNLIETEQIWKDIEESDYIDKRYLFFCEKRKGGFALRNWKELKNHGSN